VIVGEPRQAPLGNTTKLVGVEGDEAHEPEFMGRKYRYDLLDTVAEILPNARRCMYCLKPEAELVNVVRDDEIEYASYSNVAVCGSVWVCPVCSHVISEQRREETQDRLNVWHAAGFPTYHIIHTIQHHQGESCKVVVDGLLDAMTRFWNGKVVRRLQEENSLVGRVAALEGTYGFNGWHPHRHTTVFGEKWLTDEELNTLEREMSAYWQAVLERTGRYASVDYGLKIVRGSDMLADYLNKFGRLPSSEEALRAWTEASELTKANLKVSSSGLSMMGLLVAYDQTHEPEIAALFREYAEAFKGKKQLVWSPGMIDRIEALRITPRPEPVSRANRIICQIPREQWHEICKRRLRGKVLVVAGRGGDQALKDYLQGEGIRDCYYPYLEIDVLEEGVTIDLYEYVWGEVRGGDLAGDDLAGDQAGPLADVYQKSIFAIN